MSLTKWHVSALMAALLGSIGVSAGQAAELDRERLVNYFDTIVFENEMNPERPQNVVSKWQEPIKAWIQGKAKDSYPQLASKHLLRLQELTGHKIYQARTAESANFHMIFVHRYEMATLAIPGVPPALMKRLAKTNTCFLLLSRHPESKIIRTVIIFNRDRTDTVIDRCFAEETAQAFGLQNDSDDYRPSLFSDNDNLTEPSPQDEVLIRTLYDPRMKPGLPRDRARIVARTVITDILNTNPPSDSSQPTP